VKVSQEADRQTDRRRNKRNKKETCSSSFQALTNFDEHFGYR
jgi:hypothetical protein